MSHAPLPRFVLAVFSAMLLPFAASDAARGGSFIERSALDPVLLERVTLQSLQGLFEQRSDGRRVDLDLVDLRVLPDSVAGLQVDGVGRTRIGGGAWIPLHFSASYDPDAAAMQGLRVQPLTTAMRSDSAAIQAGLAERVTGQVASRLLSEFDEQTLDIVFLDLQTVEQGDGHVALRGTGRVDFVGEGPAPLAYSAILDRSSGLVIALDYSLEVIGAHGQSGWTDTFASIR